MASSKEYLAFILDQFSELEEMSYRPMMGEYILYYRGKVIGGIYDNRLLLKPVKVVMDQLGRTRLERPYEGAKEKRFSARKRTSLNYLWTEQPAIS